MQTSLDEPTAIDASSLVLSGSDNTLKSDDHDQKPQQVINLVVQDIPLTSPVDMPMEICAKENVEGRLG